MTRKPFSLAAAAVSALAIATLGMGAPAAFAAPSPAPTTIASLVDANAGVELQIHKHLGAPTAQAANGTVQNVTTPSLQGVDFDVYQVFYDAAHTQKVDLTTNKGWTDAATITNYKPSSADFAAGSFTVSGVTYYLGTATTVTTDNTGTATFDSKVGFYLVKENLASSDTIIDLSKTAPNNTVDKATVTPSDPFFVTLPMTQPDTKDSWMYTVNVYPKNQADSITKTVKDEATYTVGSDISYSLESTISPIEKLGYYYIADSNEYLTATKVTVGVTGDTLVGCTEAEAEAAGDAAACDYVYWLDADAATGSQVKVVFTDAGLTKLQNAKKANPAAVVTTTINGKVLSVPDTGVVPNQGSFIPNSSWYTNNGGTTPTPPVPGTPVTPPTPTTPGIPSNPVKSYFGNITVTKTLTGGAASDLPTGATFAVYADPTPWNDCAASDVTGTALMTKTITASNTVTFDPLRASDWANGAAVAKPTAAPVAPATTPYIQYCVVETKAPTGYNLNAEPFTATINWATGTSTLTRTAAVSIADEKSNLGNSLPLTGGEGIAALSLGGLALIGGGAGYYAFTSRKRREA